MIIFWIYALKTISATYCNFTKGKLQLKFNCKLKNLILDRYESTDHFCMSFQTDIMTITSTWLRKTYDVLCLSKREEWTIFWKSYGPIWWPSSHTDHNIDMKMPPPNDLLSAAFNTWTMILATIKLLILLYEEEQKNERERRRIQINNGQTPNSNTNRFTIVLAKLTLGSGAQDILLIAGKLISY